MVYGSGLLARSPMKAQFLGGEPPRTPRLSALTHRERKILGFTPKRSEKHISFHMFLLSCMHTHLILVCFGLP